MLQHFTSEITMVRFSSMSSILMDDINVCFYFTLKAIFEM